MDNGGNTDSDMERQPFILAELEDLSPIFAPLKATSRIKYTCFNVSSNFLIFGATSGGLYIFRREPCIFLQLLPNKEGSVIQVSISPDEKLIAFATVKGGVCILERSTSHGAKQVITTLDHQNAQITSLQWNEQNNELYVGDDTGKISVITVSLFPPKNMFQNPSFVLMQLDSKIVQMDYSSEMLLVSTLTKCYICDTSRELFRQVGHKLRDGEYGACIYNTQDGHSVIKDTGMLRDRVGFSFETDKNILDYSNLKHLKLLCARPGSRIWEVAIDGTVISTHHFKEALAVPPRNIIFQDNSSSHNGDFTNNQNLSNGSCLNNEQINSNYVEQSFNFQKLYVILSKFLFTYKTDGIYIFDPERADVVLWNNEITDIVDVKCINDVIYTWSGYGKMYALNLVPLEKFLIRLYFRKKYLTLAKLCLEYSDYLKSQANGSSKLYLLHDLDEKLSEMENENVRSLCDRLDPLFEIFRKNAQDRQVVNAQKLKSGIFLIGNHMEEKSNHQKNLRPNYLNVKSRSHSVSPDRIGKDSQLKNQGSSSSLPDLIDESPKIEETDKEEISKISEEIKNSREPSNELIFRLFDSLLNLSNNEAINNRNKKFENVRSIPFHTYFKDDHVKLISGAFHSSLKTRIVFDWLNSFTINPNNLNYPSFISDNHDTKSLELDYKLSKVLKLFANILDENQIVDLIKSANLKCYYLSLLEVVDRFQEASLSSVSDSNLNLSNISTSAKTLNILYFLVKMGQIEKCSRYSNKIVLLDMLYLIFKFQEYLKQTGKSSEIVELQCQTLLLSYVDKALNRSELITEATPFVEDYIIKCLENVNSSASCVKDATCSCGFPSPKLRPSISMFPEIGQLLIEKTWPSDPVKCIKICGDIPYLWRYLIVFRKDEPLISLLPLIIQLGEISEIENRLHEMDVMMCEISVRHLIGLKNGNCLNCGMKMKIEDDTMHWTELGLLCVKSIGPQDTLNLFSKYSSDISSKELGQSFYQALIFSTIMEKHSKGLRKNVVDLLIGKCEEKSTRLPVFSEKVKQEIFSDEGFDKEIISSPHHWGARLEIKSCCASCSLSLDSEALVSEGGLIVFKCAHAFHSVCLKKADSECPVCKK